MRKLALLWCVFTIVILYSFNSVTQMREISQEEKQELIQYLKSHWKTPEDYVVGKFSDHDLVFIGEYHRIKHDVELIQNLIPRLYEIGVRNLGIEMGCYEYQDKVDSLITADEYDEDLARWLMFRWSVTWGYQEYMDIYRKAWEVNKSLPRDAPRFRVVNLDYRPNWNLAKEEMTPELWQKVRHKGTTDEHMAQVILTEFVDKGQKALIFSGSHHAFTHYYQPIYDYETKEFKGFSKQRAGNIIYSKIPDRVIYIELHAPWWARESLDDENYPVGGVIDEIMKEFKNKRFGFDVKGTPFGKLRDDDTYYSIGYEEFTLSTICDGYIFQKQLSDYEGCAVDTDFITEENFQEAIEYLPNVRARKFFTKPEELINEIVKDAQIQRRFQLHMK